LVVAFSARSSKKIVQGIMYVNPALLYHTPKVADSEDIVARIGDEYNVHINDIISIVGIMMKIVISCCLSSLR
jgi:hypothetical protein